MENTMNSYEAMFLMDAGYPNVETAGEPVREILGRYDAEILAIKPWEERKLAYEIMGRKRGLYILSYFKMDPTKLVEVEHDCRLNENILRVLIMRKDHLDEKEINAETPAQIAAAPRETHESAETPQAETPKDAPSPAEDAPAKDAPAETAVDEAAPAEAAAADPAEAEPANVEPEPAE